ncbi:MAG: HU family DNA-binding protein [Moorellales bacterium]
MPKREKSGTQKIIDEVSRRMGCFKKDAVELLNHFTDVVAGLLAEEGRVEFRPLGVWRINKSGAVRHKPGKRFTARVQELRVQKAETQAKEGEGDETGG